MTDSRPQPAASDAAAARPTPPPVRIKAVENGPLQVKGSAELLDADGTAYDLTGRRSVTLCRCGQSAIKPFCDGAHARTGFVAPERSPHPRSTTRPADRPASNESKPGPSNGAGPERPGAA